MIGNHARSDIARYFAPPSGSSSTSTVGMVITAAWGFPLGMTTTTGAGGLRSFTATRRPPPTPTTKNATSATT